MPIVLILLNVNESFAESKSFTVQAGDEQYLNFGLNEGDRIKFWITVSGGANDDINLRIMDYQSTLSKQRIYSNYEDEILGSEGGSISFVFDNTISIISSKQVNFSYEIIQKPQYQSSYEYGSILSLILIVIGIVVVAVIIKRKRKPQVNQTKTIDKKIESSVETEQNEKALSILKGRLAKGEITKEEYDKLKKEFT
jgi:uncharacterized membrane protein